MVQGPFSSPCSPSLKQSADPFLRFKQSTNSESTPTGDLTANLLTSPTTQTNKNSFFFVGMQKCERDVSRSKGKCHAAVVVRALNLTPVLSGSGMSSQHAASKAKFVSLLCFIIGDRNSSLSFLTVHMCQRKSQTILLNTS